MIRFAVVDVETTGSGANDEMIQVGLAIVEGGQVTSTYSSFIKPNHSIPAFIQQLTGITNDLVQYAPDLLTVCEEIRPMLEDTVLIGHNIGFDLGFLQRSFEQVGLDPFVGRVLDTLDFTRMLFPSLTSYQLGMICEQFGIPLVQAHRADADAEATAIVWLHCLARLESMPLLLVQRIRDVVSILRANAVTNGADMSWFFELVIESKLDAVADGAVTPESAQNVRTYRQFVLNVDDWVTPTDRDENEEETEPLLLNEEPFDPFLESLYKQVRLQLDDFEERPSQRQMIHEVWESFRNNRHLVIEAGTGTGKSLAYLIPGLFFGLLTKQKVIVSTHTVQLQEQLRQRDVPFLQSVFPLSFDAAVLKGRNHYLCLRKFEQKINTNDFESMKDDAVAAAQMLVWLSETKFGDEEEINWGNRGNEFWQTVASDSDSCLNRACPWFRKCFYHRAKAHAQKADVVITNHSLLMTDFMTDHRLLPAYQHVVIDEAHHFEDVASRHLGLEITYFSILARMYRLYKDGRNGQVGQLKHALLRGMHPQKSEWVARLDSWCGDWVMQKEAWDQCCEWLYALLSRTRMDSNAELPQLQVRLRPERPPGRWNEFQVLVNSVYDQWGVAIRTLETLMSEMLEDESAISFDIQGILTDLSGTIKQFMRLRDGLNVFAQLSDGNAIYWIEANPQYASRSIHLFMMPVDVSGALQDLMFKAKDSVVMTSATLSVSSGFEHFCAPLGLPKPDTDKVKAVVLPSPFEYKKQALVCIPVDFPMLRGSSNETQFIQQLIHSLAEVATETKGRMLVLFTSYKMLRSVYGPLKSMLTQQNIQLIGQGVDTNNRTKLTRWFKDHDRAVLLGTSSFWEGVDIPGDSLTCLAIVKLPFQPPTHPIVEAKSEFLERQHKNAFMSYSVPQAVIRFKQGFGRLVRSAKDHGIVILYDTRVEHTRYGKYFLNSLPSPSIAKMNTSEMVLQIRNWLATKGGASS